MKQELFDIPLELRIPGIGDYNIALYAASQGKVHYLNNVMSCYRVNNRNGWSQRILCNEDAKIKHYNDMGFFFQQFDKFTEHKYRRLCLEKVFWYYSEVVLYKNSFFQLILYKSLRKKFDGISIRKKLWLYKQVFLKDLRKLVFRIDEKNMI